MRVMTHHKHLHPARLKPTKHSDLLVWWFSITTPLFMLPQLFEILNNRSAANVAIATWVYFLLSDIVWTVYGIQHKMLPLIWCHILYFLIESAIVVAILVYS
jgi:uncharacterized protein with PQ loop repeat